jgi:DNA sulfur modification protein DndC
LPQRYWDWLPIHALTVEDIWATIQANGNQFHEAYSLGNQRLSCALCVLGSLNDLLNGALHNPEIYLELCRIELESGITSLSKGETAIRHGFGCSIKNGIPAVRCWKQN